MYNELQAELSCYCKKAKFTCSKETVIYATISKEVKKLFQCSIAFAPKFASFNCVYQLDMCMFASCPDQ